jgi:hypothetical protein
MVIGAALGAFGVLFAASDDEENRNASQAALARARDVLSSWTRMAAREPYSKTIPHLFIGYDADGVAREGVAMRSFKTYEWVTALIVVKREGERFVVAEAGIPDVGVIRNPKKQGIVMSVIQRVKGTVVRDEAQQLKTIDAVTGATRYHKRIYTYFDTMAKALVQEMTAATPAPPAQTK